MSTPAHLWLEDENGSPIVGSCLMPLRLGSIELKSFSHGVTIPVDPNWGKLTGTRVHSPITIVKEFDQTSISFWKTSRSQQLRHIWLLVV